MKALKTSPDTAAMDISTSTARRTTAGGMAGKGRCGPPACAVSKAGSRR